MCVRESSAVRPYTANMSATIWRCVRQMTESSGSVEKRARDMRAGRHLDRIPDHLRKDTDELAQLRFDMTKLTAAFLAQLEPHARAAAEEEGAARSLAAVFDRNGKRPAAKVREVELTDAVIRRLDSKTFTIVLPDPPAMAQK